VVLVIVKNGYCDGGSGDNDGKENEESKRE
jgi:hypothetical protein